MLHLFHLRISPGTLGFLHPLPRKLAHLAEYVIFGVILYGVPGEQSKLLWRPSRTVIFILSAVAYSLKDEYHQLHVPGRRTSLFGCALGTVGASLAMLAPYTQKQISLLRSTSPSF